MQAELESPDALSGRMLAGKAQKSTGDVFGIGQNAACITVRQGNERAGSKRPVKTGCGQDAADPTILLCQEAGAIKPIGLLDRLSPCAEVVGKTVSMGKDVGVPGLLVGSFGQADLKVHKKVEQVEVLKMLSMDKEG